MTGGRHRSNMELVANGFVNIVTPVWDTGDRCYCKNSYKISETAEKLLLPDDSFSSSLSYNVFSKVCRHDSALCTFVSILVIVSFNMFDFREFKSQQNAEKGVAVLITTFLLTVIFDLTVAILRNRNGDVWLFIYEQNGEKLQTSGIITREFDSENSTASGNN